MSLFNKWSAGSQFHSAYYINKYVLSSNHIKTYRYDLSSNAFKVSSTTYGIKAILGNNNIII